MDGNLFLHWTSMTASKRARDEEAGRHAHEVASFEAELAAEVSTPPTRMASAGLRLACGGQPRRLVLVLLFMLVAVAALTISRQEQIARFARVRNCADRFRQRLNFTDFVKDMRQDEFARYYRLPSRAAFDDVLSRVSPPAEQVAFRAARARKSTGGFVPYSLRLSMALRYMAGGSALDIMYLHGVGRSTFYNCIWPMLRAIDEGLPAFSLPDDIKSLARCRRLAAGFSRRTDGHIQGAITAWDGIIFKVQADTISSARCPNPLKFHCRKGFPGVSVQAGCDADRRFTFMACDFAASVHDSRAYRMARLPDDGPRISDLIENSPVLATKSDPHDRALVAAGESHPAGFFLLGDDAFKASDTMVVPWSTVRDRWWRDSFNYQQSRARINVECSFGMLIKKFLILARCASLPGRRDPLPPPYASTLSCSLAHRSPPHPLVFPAPCQWTLRPSRPLCELP